MTCHVHASAFISMLLKIQVPAERIAIRGVNARGSFLCQSLLQSFSKEKQKEKHGLKIEVPSEKITIRGVYARRSFVRIESVTRFVKIVILLFMRASGSRQNLFLNSCHVLGGIIIIL